MIQHPGLGVGLGVGGKVGQTRETETLSKGYGLPGQRLGHGCDGMCLLCCRQFGQRIRSMCVACASCVSCSLYCCMFM